ncbi:MAG: hypothetical protein Q7N50_04315 [Armatimonadota bacterium]|nr:hypothetical protein [Armatimonadota bacterium]
MAEVMTQEQKAARKTVEEAKKGVEQLKAGEPGMAAAQVQEGLPTSVYMYATGGSILASLLLYLFKKRETGIFVGLWAPTILNMALFYKLLRPSKETQPEM